MDKQSTQIIEVVGFNRRLAASLLDGLLLGFLTFLLTTAIGFVALFIDIFRPEQIIPFDTLIIEQEREKHGMQSLEAVGRPATHIATAAGLGLGTDQTDEIQWVKESG